MKLKTRHIFSAGIAITFAMPSAFAGVGSRQTSVIEDRGTAPTLALDVDHEMQGMAGLRLSQYANLRARFGHSMVSTIDPSGAPVRATSSATLGTALAVWTFVNSTKQAASTAVSPSATNTYTTADSGSSATSAASGTHASILSAWSYTNHTSTSDKAYTADHWATNDYWQFTLSTVGFNGVTLSWDQAGSSSGPKSFQLQYSVDGNTFNPINVAGTNVSNTGAYTVGTAFTTYSVDLSSISGLNNDPTAAFRLVDTSATTGGAIGGGNVGATGSDKVDNFTVNGLTAVPEPSTWVGAGLALVAIGWVQRRRLLALVGIA